MSCALDRPATFRVPSVGCQIAGARWGAPCSPAQSARRPPYPQTNRRLGLIEQTHPFGVTTRHVILFPLGRTSRLKLVWPLTLRIHTERMSALSPILHWVHEHSTLRSLCQMWGSSESRRNSATEAPKAAGFCIRDPQVYIRDGNVLVNTFRVFLLNCLPQVIHWEG